MTVYQHYVLTSKHDFIATERPNNETGLYTNILSKLSIMTF